MADVPIPLVPSMSTEMKIFGGRWAAALPERSVERTRTAERRRSMSMGTGYRERRIGAEHDRARYASGPEHWWRGNDRRCGPGEPARPRCVREHPDRVRRARRSADRARAAAVGRVHDRPTTAP